MYLGSLPVYYKDYIVELLGDFLHDGSHGSHVCLVTKPMGRQLRWHFPTSSSIILCRSPKTSIQALQALVYLHQQEVMHGDVHPGNLNLALTDDIDDDTETEIEAKNGRGNELNDPDESYTLEVQSTSRQAMQPTPASS